MDWKNPKTFNQKLQWMKLYDKNPLYSLCADKIAVRSFVAAAIGEQYLVPCLGVYDRAEDIDYNALPERFVLKCNHGAKLNIICKDKSKLDIPAANAALNKWLKIRFWHQKREYHYKAIKPRIICEQYMEDENSDTLNDYKIFTFAGKPYMIQVDLDRFGEHRRNIYDTNWNLLDVEISFPKGEDIPKPSILDRMLDCAKKLAEGFAEVRVDFYVVNGKLFFGEMTFFSGAGFSKYDPPSFERQLGDLLILPDGEK
ncbi:MAG: glycosyl transferase [Clostridia bacterium]|nr:glycosyl transferase [Clostridia bacterium]